MDLTLLQRGPCLLFPELILGPDGARREAGLAVENGRIRAVDSPAALAERFPGWAALPLPGQAIVPGFVDAHIHLGQAFGKSLTGGEPSQIWQRIWIPLEKTLHPELSYLSAKWMFLEALRGGFTTICNFALINAEKARAIHRAAEETGIRLVSSTGSVDRADYPNTTGITPTFEPLESAIRRADEHLELCEGLERVTPSLCVSGVQAASPDLIRVSAEYCHDKGIVFQVHANEHHPEVHACVTLHGKRPTEYVADAGGLGAQTLVHHAAVVTEHEINLIEQSGAALSYNPVACMWKLDAVAPAMAYAERGMRMGLGTDSTRSDALRMIDAAEACQRLTRGMQVMDFSCGAGWTWVDAATRGGADACGLGGVTGSLAEGYRADFLILDMRAPEVLPSWDFEWELVRQYNRDQIGAVVIDGRVVMERGRPTGWDMDEFLNDALPRALAAVGGAEIVRRHGTSAEHRARRAVKH